MNLKTPSKRSDSITILRLVRVLVAGSVLGDGIVGIILIDLVHGLLIHGLLIHGRVVHVEHGLHGRLYAQVLPVSTSP